MEMFKRLDPVRHHDEQGKSLEPLLDRHESEENPEKAFSIAHSYFNGGNGLPRNPIASANWYMRAAELGDADAFVMLASIFSSGIADAEYGNGIPRDRHRARKYLEIAERKQHDPSGQFLISEIFLELDDRESWMHWLRIAAESGYPQARYKVALLMLDSGQEDDAISYLEFAAAHGITEAKYSLGVAYYFGQGIRQDYCHAYRLFEDAAGYGHEKAMVYLGYMYLNGQYVSQNSEGAKKWFLKAADLGDAEGLFWAARFCVDRKDYSADDAIRAATFFAKSAKGGYPKSLIALGDSYLHGLGVTKSLPRAMAWFTLATRHKDMPKAELEHSKKNARTLAEKLNEQEKIEASKLIEDLGKKVPLFYR